MQRRLNIVWFLIVVTAVAILGFAFRLQSLRGSAEALLEKADDLSWNNQWLASAPLYREAEEQFLRESKASKALYAHVSQLISHAEYENIADLLFTLNQDLILPAASDPETRLRILLIKGMIEVNYDAAMARTTWKEVEDLAKRRHHYLLASRAIGEEGIAAFLLGDISAAKKQVVTAWGVAKYLGDPAARVRYASVYGAGLVGLHRYQEALTILDEAISVAEKNKGIAYPTIAVNSKIDALRGLHRYGEALNLSEEALRRLPNQRLDSHRYQLSTSQGQIYEDMNRWEDAITQYTLSLQHSEQLEYWRGIAETAGLLARAYEHQNNLTKALETIDQAIAANTHIPEELYYVPRNLGIKAEILWKQGRVKESHELYEKSSNLIDSLIATASTPTVERLVLTQLSDVYSGYFEALSSEKDYAGAFQVIERARGRLEAQALEHRRAASPHPPTPVEQKLTMLNLQLIKNEDPIKRQELMRQIYDAELHLEDTSLAGRTANNPVALNAVRKDLDDSKVIIEYVLGEPHSFALAITRNSVASYTLPSRAKIEADAGEYRRLLRSRKADLSLGQRLFDELLAPVSEYHDKAKVVVVPDGVLHLLPFSALVENGQYVVTTHTFSNSPSATVLHILMGRERSDSHNPLPYVGVAAWTKVEEHKNAIIRAVSGPGRTEFTALPESETEVRAIAADLPKPSTLLIGAAATETEFKKLPLQNYDVLHLALHGYADLEYPDRSSLVFAPQQQATDDGLLQVREIRRFHLNARLVTLSACDTGVGPVGESGVANLVNAFIEAGSKSVVSALWELEDHTTAHLMTVFYGNLARHQNKAAALREAQLDLLKAGLPPYHWASFELVGDPDGSF